MKTVNELICKLVNNGWDYKAIPKKEYIELGDRIQSVDSPLTNKPVTLNTYVSYKIGYDSCHSWKQLGRERLGRLLIDVGGRCTYKPECVEVEPQSFFAA